jgi:hypothetical protein
MQEAKVSLSFSAKETALPTFRVAREVQQKHWHKFLTVEIDLSLERAARSLPSSKGCSKVQSTEQCFEILVAAD